MLRCDYCKDGWKLHPDNRKCYKFVQEKKDWFSSQNQCIHEAPNMFGDLAAVQNQKTQDFLDSLSLSFRASSAGLAWLGGFRIGSVWKWSDGSRWDYSPWKIGTPLLATRYSGALSIFPCSSGSYKAYRVDCLIVRRRFLPYTMLGNKHLPYTAQFLQCF